MKVPKGIKIIAIDEDKVLISEGDWPPEASSVIDFSARYVESSGKTVNGDSVFGGRGFRYRDKDTIWKFA